ncbi:phospholipase A2, membrane associated [Phacochoerus africanus]|uniref:phospholipase A2, membrane associated n=1 Tax=Phacochoerus africanus TaxID=41426 RepID=UPI001FD98C4A|nr:phospholipase A2, membrane associated [Phacochoerus africanus]
MKTLLLLAVIMAFGLLQVQGNVLNFHKMIKLKTGKSPVPNYAFYGCYCGLGGKASPKDATDFSRHRCCAAHDCCYKQLKEHLSSTKLLNYKFVFHQGQTIGSEVTSDPETNHYEGKRDDHHWLAPIMSHSQASVFRAGVPIRLGVALLRGQGFCLPIKPQDDCRRQLCQCDKTAADCFARNLRTYNVKLQYYSNLRCTGTAPKC